MDDNEEIMELLRKRLELGKRRYGHGVRVNDDTRQWGTETNDWELMMLEEALDGMIYSAAAMIRVMRSKKNASENLYSEILKYKYIQST